MPGRPYVLAESTWDTVRATRYEVAVLPWGSTEAHNTHLPYGADVLQSEAIATEAARLAWQAGAKVVVLPPVPFGVQTGQREIPLCLNVNPSTQAAVLGDLCASLAGPGGGGVRKLVVVNGHGGNDFKQIIRELTLRTDLLLSQINWWQVVKAADFFDVPGDHAGEMETSLLMHLHASLVQPLSTAGRGTARPFTVQGFREGWAWTQRHWVEATADTGVGDPRAATAEKGRKFFEAVTVKIGGFLRELAAADPAKLYAEKR